MRIEGYKGSEKFWRLRSKGKLTDQSIEERRNCCSSLARKFGQPREARYPPTVPTWKFGASAILATVIIRRALRAVSDDLNEPESKSSQEI